VKYRFGQHALDTDSLELKAGAEALTAEPQVFQVLQYLIENRERVVTKDDITEAVWGGRIVSDSALTYAVKEARRLVGDDGKAQAVIRTLPRRGFRFVADVIEEPPTRRAEPAGGAPADAANEASIAVLPFENMSGDPQQGFFADGLTEDIITALSNVARLRVIARHSTFAYKGRALNLRQVAEELGVRHILEGSVQRSGERLRITAQLIEAETDSHLWAERYDRSVQDLFDIQDDISKEIVTSLRVKLTDGEEARVWARGTNDIEAWQYCVRATELVREFTASSYLEARVLAEKATELDPDYAQAWAALGFTYWTDGRFGEPDDAEAKFVRADECAQRALALDDSASWVIGLSAVVAGSLGRCDEGIEIARRGIELNPSNPDLRAWLGWVLISAGNYREAEEQVRAAMFDNRFFPNYYRGVLTKALICQDHFDEALGLCDEALALEPAYLGVWLYRAYICRETGRAADATAAIAEVRRIAPGFRVRHVPGIIQIREAAFRERYLDGLRQAGLPE